MKKKKIYLIIVGILLVVAMITGVSYALWMKTFSQTGNNTIASDCFNISFLEDTNSNIKLENTFPIRNNEGMNLKPYTFSVTNKCSNEVSYEINLETTTNTTMKDNYVKVMIGENTPRLLTSYVSGNKTLSNGKSSYVLESGNLTGNTTNNYKLRIWMDENVTQDMENAMNSVFESKITVTGTYIKNYHESILNGSDPVLKDNLIPVTISDDGTVKKADIREEWYNYQNKTWANAVILSNQYEDLKNTGKVFGAVKEKDFIKFDGVDDYIDLGYKNTDFGSEIAIAIQVSFSTLPQENTKIISNAEGSGFSIEIHDGYFSFAPRVGSSYNILQSKTKIELNKIYHVVATYDGTMERIYVNGVLENEKSLSGKIVTSTVFLALGGNPNALGTVTEDILAMNLYDFQIYNRIMNTEEALLLSKDTTNIQSNEKLLERINVKENRFENGQIIPEKDIESYFVWIPRYKYQIFNDGNYPGLTNIENRVQEIKVVFENKNTTMSNGNTVGSWLTHPAFTAFDTNGIWVGKYETGYKGANSTGEAQVNSNEPSKLQIKPNVYSWRGINIANAHLNSYNYQRNLDSHMMKNTEWGTVAYLQHSKYGSMQSVRINNNNSYITGYAAVSEPTCGYTSTNEACNKYEVTALNADGTFTKRYNSATGYLASTTGNISGIYDMSGGAWDFVMGVMVDKNGNPMSGRNNTYNSGFNGTFGCPTCDSDTSGKTSKTDGINFPDKKYYDTYAYAENYENFQRRILGDATGELGPFSSFQNRTISSWYADDTYFIYHGKPWFRRGALLNYGTGSGMFSFNYAEGNMNNVVGYRIVLAV